MVKSPSAKRRKRKSGQVPKPRAGSNAGGAAPGLREDLALLGAYQRQICDLEETLTTFRRRVANLESTLAQSRAAHEHLAELFQAAPVGYLLLDDHAVIQEVNQRAARLLGFPRGAHSWGSLLQFAVHSDVSRLLAHLRQCKASGQQVSTELNLRARDGRQVPVELITVPEPAQAGHRVRHFRSILLDNTRRHQAERALIQTQQDYQRFVDTVEGIVWEADAKTLDIRFVSGFAERLLGYPLEQWRQPDFWENHIYVQDRERVTNQVARAVARGRPLVLEYRAVTADRRLLWLHDCIRVTADSNRLRLLGIAVDITERKQAEEMLQQARDNLERRVTERTAELRESVGQLEAFSYSLSHDMRAPLRAMHSYSQILISQFGAQLGERGQDYLRRIISSAERLDALVQDVLRYSRVAREPLEMKPVDLDRLVETVIQDYPALQPPRATVEIKKPLLPVRGHAGFLTQCFSNLLSNAVKFVPPGTQPHVSVWAEALREPLPSSGPADCPPDSPAPTPDGSVRIWIQDNGIGIAPEDQQRIFGIFQRIYPASQYEGTGIGLAIVQKAIERMGGRLGVESTVGHGSRFWLELPRART